MFTLLICAVLFLGAVNALAESVDLPIATIEMENGDVMKLELYPDIAPNTVANFIELANAGFYDGLIFHRVIPGFMIQGGDPTGTGMGGPGYAIKGEFAANGFENKLSHERGVISMARANDPNSARSQFFIMHADYPALDGNYAAFGRVIEGIEAVDHVAEGETGKNDRPVEDQVIKSIRVETNGVEYKAEKIQ
jgi:peptidyl-prolyl cis-trans isomerase B (cyclophilin B)